MALLPVRCPQCKSDQVVKRGKTSNEKQRYLCQNEACPRQTFVVEYNHRGRRPRVKRQIVDMALNGSGIRNTARVLGISKDTVLSELKKGNRVIEPVNTALLRRLNPGDIVVDIQHVAEADEMWSFVGSKKAPR